MFALAAFRRVLPLILACTLPLLHSHALMHALAFTLHLSSPLSRMVSSRAVSVVHVPRRYPTLFSSFLSLLSSCHPFRPVTYFFTFQSHPSYLLYPFTPLASLHLPSSVDYTSLPPSFSSHPPLYTCFFTLHFCLHPSSSHHLSLFHPSAGSYVGCSVKSALGAAIEAQNE